MVVGDFIYSFGGYCSSDEYKLNHTIDVHVLNTHNLRWFLIPPKRDSTGALLEYPAVPFQRFDGFLLLAINKQIKTKLFHCRYGHSAVAYKQKVYMWGGRNDEMCCSILFCFDTITHQWTKPEVNGEIPAVRDGRKIVTFVSEIGKYISLSLQVILLVLSTIKCTYSEVSKNKPIGSHVTFIV